MIKSTIFFILLFNLSKIAKAGQTQQKHLAQNLEYPRVFNKESEVSVIVTSCGDMKKLQITIKSFLYFNTYPISKMYIVHCSNQQPNMESVLPQGYITNKQKFEIISLKSGNSLIDALEQVYKRIQTHYVYQTDSLWQMKKGFGFIQQALNVLKYGQSQSMKMSQIVANYPYWRPKYRLSQLMWASSMQCFHLVIPFKPQQQSFFSVSPSVFNIKVIYQQIFGKKIKQICTNNQKCNKFKQSQKHDFDRCCLRELGRLIFKSGYFQIYINDGTGQPNHNRIFQ